MNAIYYYQEYLFEKGFQNKSAPVEIIKETAKQYLIKLVGVWVRGKAPGSTMWVQKRHVAVEKTPVDCSNQWWNN